MSSESRTVRLRVVGMNMPSSEGAGSLLIFGLQDKQGALQRGQLRSDGVLIYECEAKASQRENGKPNFTGSYLHGTPQERFLYLSLRAVDDSNWIRRSKIMLGDITWEMVEEVHGNRGVLEVVVDGLRAPRAHVVTGWQVKAV